MKAFATLAVFAMTTGILLADSKKDLEKMAGKWQPTSMQLGKAKMPDDQVKKITLQIDGEKYTVTAESPDKGTLKLDSTTKPKSMDITGAEGPNKGKKFLCIYELDGDKLKICYDLEGKTRPKEFKASGDKILLVTYKRMK